MKKLLIMIYMLTIVLYFSACGNRSSQDSQEQFSDAPSISESMTLPQESESEKINSELPIAEEEGVMKGIEIIIGNQTFSVTLYDNESTEALIKQLPMTFDMSELNGNEKYYYLSESLPVNSSRPSGINVGDLMLYGDNCLVLFYESFSTNYSYTPLGHIDNPDRLASVLGSGDVEVTFQIK